MVCGDYIHVKLDVSAAVSMEVNMSSIFFV